MKKIHLIVALLTISISSFSQTAAVDTSWKKGGFIGLNFTQLNLSNWAQGGQNSVTLASTANLFANYIKGKTDWENSADFAYSMVQSGKDKAKKSDDRIDITSKYSRNFSQHWLYGLLVNFKSQFAKGYNYPDDSNIVSKFFSPAYLTISPGITYKPVDYFEVLISPATGKITFVNDKNLSDAGAYGVTPGKMMRSEFGAYLNMKFKKDIMQNVSLITKLELFDNYTDKDKNNRTNVDVNWENIIAMKVNKYITATISTQLIYDDNVVKRTQFKESVGIGFGYKFGK